MSGEPTKAYYVEEAVKGTMLLLVYARTGTEAREKVLRGDRGEDVDTIDTQIHPNGVRRARRAPEEDRDE